MCLCSKEQVQQEGAIVRRLSRFCRCFSSECAVFPRSAAVFPRSAGLSLPKKLLCRGFSSECWFVAKFYRF